MLNVPTDAYTCDETRHFLIASDFDQTRSFNHSGLVLAELLGMKGFEECVAGLAESNLVEQGGRARLPHPSR